MDVTIVFVFILHIIIVHAKHILLNSNYTRDKIIEEELKLSIGGNITLTEKEEKVNEILIKSKLKELNEGHNDSRHFKLSRSYFDFKDEIKQSHVYKLLKVMPKAAALHLHTSAVLGPDFFLNVTYRDYLHVCQGKHLHFWFSYFEPNKPCDTKWELMSKVRNAAKNLTQFDNELKNQFSLANVNYTSVDELWKKFSSIFVVVSNLWTHRPVWEQYVREMIRKFSEDHVIYAEVRNILPQLYELDGSTHDDVFFVNTTKNIVESLAVENKNFLGIKMIICAGRNVATKYIQNYIDRTRRLKKIFPDFIAGFDLVGYEDRGRTLLERITELKTAQSDTEYFFHAGETNWYGASADENLIDAVLLGTKRIGHGFALEKHPLILQKVKENNIGLEVNVVSNNILNYVHDMRNHPLALFISQNLPVVLSSDDPGFWDAEVLTTDFYVAFIGIASQRHDLRLLKKLALNSIEYSAMTNMEKTKAYSMFQNQWNLFIDNILKRTLELRLVNA